MTPTGYIICATPRSGSTMLCELLTAAGAGRPMSYFRAQDIDRWSTEWNLPCKVEVGDECWDAACLQAVRSAGMADTSIFGLRIMWDSVAPLCDRLRRAQGGDMSCATRLEDAFGPLLYVHLSRRDQIAQAVSLVRAEQSGLWHIHADGGERQRTAPPRTLTYDAVRLREVEAGLERDERAWAEFFMMHRIKPLRLTYEELAADPRRMLATVLTALDHDAHLADVIEPATGRMADRISSVWADRFRVDNARTR